MAVVKDKKQNPQAKKTETYAATTKKTEPSVQVKTEKSVKTPEPAKPVFMAFGRENYLIMLGGILLLILGFTIMALDSAEFGFGFMGLVLGPIVVMLGFVTEFFAILRKPKTN